MSSLAGRVRLPRVTVLSVVVGLVCGGRRWAPRRAPWRLVAGCLGRLPGLSERRRGAPGNGQLLDGQRSSGSGRSPFPVGGVWPADDWGAESAAPRAREDGGARGGACALARHAVGARGAVVGGSPWSASGRAALLEPPAAAAAAAVRCPGNLLELWSKRGPANPRREGALLSRHEGVHQHTKTFWAGRRGSRADV
mgnify:CR=1 FL=1